MKKISKIFYRTITVAAVAGALLSPIVAKEVMAQGAYVACSVISNPAICTTTPGCTYNAGVCSGTSTNPTNPTNTTPEMSDYLAMAFVVMAGGMIYYFRRRATA